MPDPLNDWDVDAMGKIPVVAKKEEPMRPPKLYIAVPVGETCECRKVVHDHFQFDGVVYRTIGASYRPKDITHGKPEAIDPEAIVQPVRLVPSDVLDRVLAALEPGAEPTPPNPSASTWSHNAHTGARRLWQRTQELHATVRAIIEEAMPKCQ